MGEGNHLRDRLVSAVGDHYLIEAELGRGGMAVVFRALDLRLNRRVAIKLLPPELAFNPSVRSRFLREAQMAAQLTHPNIVPIFSVDERDKDGLVYFVMAFVDGESLAARLRRDGAMRIEDVRLIVSEVADALDYAHRQGVVHRDIKPDNILVDRMTGRPLVTDFGIARAAAEESRLTVTGVAVGTPAYMSPEQAMGEREVDGRSDLYSLGIVAYQMVSGETPFKAINTPAMLMKHVSEPPPPLRGKRPDAPANLVFAVERALAKKPDDRWRSGAEMRDAILDRAMRAYPPAPPAALPPVLREAPPPLPESRVPVPQMFTAAPRDLSRRERKESRREQRDALKAAVHERYGQDATDNKIASKISRFRRALIAYPATALGLLVINAASGGDPWFLFPTAGLTLALLMQAGWLWGEGVSFRQVFVTPPRGKSGAPRPELLPTPRRDQNELASHEILAGPYGPTIRRASAGRDIITDVLRRLTAKERELLPADLEATVDALVDRVASVGTTLHRLDADANGSHLGSLDDRIASLKRDAPSTERDRRLALLERQSATLRDLLERRGALLTQLESASMALETLKLDLVRFRSAGVSTALEDVTSATREARAVSRDIEHLLDAHDEVRRL